jgi:hypothetical protein
MMKTNNLTEPSAITTETGGQYEIPEGGSLGLLALGYVGVMLWRQKIEDLRKEQQTAATGISNS